MSTLAKLIGPPPEAGTEQESNLFNRVEIIHGPHQDHFPVAGRSVGYVRQAVGDYFNIPKDAEALIDGRPVPDGEVLQPGDDLFFSKASGRKGVGRFCWDDKQMCKFFKVTLEDLDDWEAQGCKVLRANDGSRRWTEDAIDEFMGLQKACGSFPVIDEITVSFLTPLQLRLFKVAWGHPGTPLEDAIEKVYGHNAGNKDNAMKQLAKLVNCKLLENGINRVVSLGGSKVALE